MLLLWHERSRFVAAGHLTMTLLAASVAIIALRHLLRSLTSYTWLVEPDLRGI
jgi:hypothetical protein